MRLYFRIIFHLMVFLLCLFYAVPNLYPEQPIVIVKYSNEAPCVECVLKKHDIPYLKIDKKNQELEIYFASTDDQLSAKDKISDAFVNESIKVGLNLKSQTPELFSFFGASPMKLGLDLRGGVHFLIEVDTQAINSRTIDGTLDGIKSDLMEERMRFKNLIKVDDEQTIAQLILAPETAPSNVVKHLSKRYKNLYFEVDGENPHLVNITNRDNSSTGIEDNVVDQTIESLNKRVNELGIAEAVIQKQGKRQISVDMPGIQDITRAKSLIGKTATLKFQLVAPPSAPGTLLRSDKDGHEYNLYPDVALTGQSIIYASANVGQNGPQVQIQLDSDAGAKFNRFTRSHIKERLAVTYVEQIDNPDFNPKVANSPRTVMRETVISAPVIQSALGFSFVINGIGDLKDAEDLALLLRSGALAAPISIVEETTIGPSLGEANIEKGFNSLAIGSLVVVIFMLMYYRFFGLVANLALVVNVLMIISALSILGATLTLPGIAGIVLTVGMAVDANVLIYERIREEIRKKVGASEAIKIGYDKALSTIVDANLTTLIVALVLFGMGSGTIKGFAVTLTIGLLASMYSAIFVTRAIFDCVYSQSNESKLSIGI